MYIYRTHEEFLANVKKQLVRQRCFPLFFLRFGLRWRRVANSFGEELSRFLKQLVTVKHQEGLPVAGVALSNSRGVCESKSVSVLLLILYVLVDNCLTRNMNSGFPIICYLRRSA